MRRDAGIILGLWFGRDLSLAAVESRSVDDPHDPRAGDGQGCGYSCAGPDRGRDVGQLWLMDSDGGQDQGFDEKRMNRWRCSPDGNHGSRDSCGYG